MPVPSFRLSSDDNLSVISSSQQNRLNPKSDSLADQYDFPDPDIPIREISILYPFYCNYEVNSEILHYNKRAAGSTMSDQGGEDYSQKGAPGANSLYL
jgi:hypothetical protein